MAWPRVLAHVLARWSGPPDKPQTASLVSSWPLVFATVAVPCVALATLWRSRWRPRIAFAGIAVLALAVMVAGYPVTDPSPFGSLLFRLYDQSAVAAAFRTTYKAGPGLMLGVGVLFGVGATACAVQLGAHRRFLSTAALSVTVGLVALSALPMWTGKLYSPRQQVGAIPAYWRQSMRWLNAKGSNARVLVLPGSFYTQYRWGTPGDDIFDAFLKPSHIVPGADFFGKGDAAINAVDSLYERIVAGHYQPGELGPIARRVGINFVLVRNDLDWQRSGLPRPSSLDSVRSDPDLRPVADFGRPGENVVRGGDRSLEVFPRQPASAGRGLRGHRWIRFRTRRHGWSTVACIRRRRGLAPPRREWIPAGPRARPIHR